MLDDGPMGKDYGAIALPVHVFIDRSGKISTYRLGEMSPSEIEDAIKKICLRKSMLRGATSTPVRCGAIRNTGFCSAHSPFPSSGGVLDRRVPVRRLR